MKTCIPFMLAVLLYPTACSAAPQTSNAITYDQQKRRPVDSSHSVVLDGDLNVHDSSRYSQTQEKYFCEAQTLDLEIGQRFENKGRVSVDLVLHVNDKKISGEEISNASNNLEGYRFYDTAFNCLNGTMAVRVTGYKFGANGTRPHETVFSYVISLETGERLVPSKILYKVK